MSFFFIFAVFALFQRISASLIEVMHKNEIEELVMLEVNEPSSQPTRDIGIIRINDSILVPLDPVDQDTIVIAKLDEKITSLPTDSLRPSPSPTFVPTLTPTGTPRPSLHESDIPTESPEPSPYPTQTPSFHPTFDPTFSPTMNPTKKPSSSPTIFPSRSLSPTERPSTFPSLFPTELPTKGPSTEPTRSHQPTLQPNTGSPSLSLSMIPSGTDSSTPSNTPESARFSTLIAVTIDLHDTMGPNLRDIWETQTKEFITQQWNTDMPPPNGIDMVVTHIQIVEQTDIPSRRMEESSRLLHEAGLRVRFNVTADVTPANPPEGFDFRKQVERPFLENYNMYIYRLHSVHEVFADLVNPQQEAKSSITEVKGSGSVVGIVVASMGSIALAIGAGMYAISMKKQRRGLGPPSNLAFHELVGTDSNSTIPSPANDEVKPLTPSSVEKGSQRNRYPRNVKSLIEEMIASNEYNPENDKNSDLGAQLTKAVLGTHDQSHTIKSDPPALRPGITSGRPTALGSLCYSDDESNTSPKSVDLTPMSQPGSTRHLGARPMNNMEINEFEIETSLTKDSVDSYDVPKRSGLYDIFAPSGPLGIVVDTTRDGPVVHSMKANSPLQGLVTPGDIIVGLDDMDTRSMTAATLTRLMAKRSSQSERKITLLAVDGTNITT
mmetsp:Transcript_3512/g.4067  ORF Transcript_3512/g.4067 Transcript_3512/m.4067 type:complete len:664 (-) Transcript_3512:293-2284(-)